MRTPVAIGGLTILTTVFYAYISHLVPQKITYPPEDVALSADMSTAQMVTAGEEIMAGKGTCLSCHTIGSHDDAARFPDLGGIGATAGSRREGMNDVEYLAESIYDPGAFIVEGFNPGMIAPNKPPISLNDQEILAVIAYLQSLGGTPTVTMQTRLEYAGEAPSTATATLATSGPEAEAVMELFTQYACITCHNLSEPVKLIGPSLYDVANRLTVAEIYESILDPDRTLAEGYDPGLMIATLGAVQFYDKVTAPELKQMVDYLAGLKGDE